MDNTKLENLLFVSGYSLFTFGLLIKLIRVWRDDARVASGYIPVENQEEHLEIQEAITASSSSSITLLEGSILTCTFLQFGLSCTLLIIGWLEEISSIVMFYHLALALGWIYQLLVLYLALHQSSTAPRYSFFSCTLAMCLNTYLLWILDPLSDPVYNLLNQISLGLSVLLLLLDFFNPAKNAKIIENIKIRGRYPSGERTASPYSLLSFSWVNNLLEAGIDHPLESEDMPNLAKEDEMPSIVESWAKFKKPGRSVIWNSVLFTKRFAFFQIFLAVLSTILDFAKPFFSNFLRLTFLNYF